MLISRPCGTRVSTLTATIQIRAGRQSDLQKFTGLAQRTFSQAFGDSFDPGDLDAHLESHLSAAKIARMLAEDEILVAEGEGRLLGFVQLGAADAGLPGAQSGELELRRLYVEAETQNAGLGARLMQAALDLPAARTAPQIWLDVWEANLDAIRFYQRFGFRIVGTRTFEVASDAKTDLDLIMVRRLSQ